MSPNEIIQRSISMARNFPGKFGDKQYGDAGQANQINPIGAAESSGLNKAETPTLSLRFALNAELFKNFVLEAAYNNRTSYTEAYVARGTYDSYNPNPSTGTYLYNKPIGDSTLSYTNNRVNINQYNVSGNYSFNYKNKNQFKVQGGFQGFDNTFKSINSSRAGLLDPTRPYFNLVNSNPAQPGVGGSATDNALAGFFAKVNYAYSDKYLLELTGRYDGSSRFSSLVNAQWGTFYGASAGWIITKEKFMENIPSINFAKLRLSYGQIGNQDIPGGNYPFVTTINSGTAYYFNNVLTRGSALNGFPNESLQWETSIQKNIGIDLVFFSD
jgi:TonB dependent receptor